MLDTVVHVNLAKGFRGGERQTVLLIEYLKKENPTIKQILVCRKNSEIPFYVSQVPDLEIVQVGGRFGGHLCVGTRGQIIQAHDAKGVHWAGLHHFLYKTPFVITRRVPQTLKNNFVTRYCYGNASSIVSVSNAIRESVIASFGSSMNFSGRLRLIYDALAHMKANPEQVAKIREEYKGLTIFGHIGAYVDRHKGQKVLIAAARDFVKKYPNCVFIFLGAGKDEEELKAISADIPQIKWLGFKNNIVDYMESLDFFVFPSRNEGLGSVLLDIMDHKIPIIASRVDGIPEIVHDHETGLLFENESFKDLLKCMYEVMENPALKAKLVEGAYNSLTKYRPEAMANNHFALYTEILSQQNK